MEKPAPVGVPVRSTRLEEDGSSTLNPLEPRMFQTFAEAKAGLAAAARGSTPLKGAPSVP